MPSDETSSHHSSSSDEDIRLRNSRRKNRKWASHSPIQGGAVRREISEVLGRVSRQSKLDVDANSGHGRVEESRRTPVHARRGSIESQIRNTSTSSRTSENRQTIIMNESDHSHEGSVRDIRRSIESRIGSQTESTNRGLKLPPVPRSPSPRAGASPRGGSSFSYTAGRHEVPMVKKRGGRRLMNTEDPSISSQTPSTRSNSLVDHRRFDSRLNDVTYQPEGRNSEMSMHNRPLQSNADSGSSTRKETLDIMTAMKQNESFPDPDTWDLLTPFPKKEGLDNVDVDRTSPDIQELVQHGGETTTADAIRQRLSQYRGDLQHEILTWPPAFRAAILAKLREEGEDVHIPSSEESRKNVTSMSILRKSSPSVPALRADILDADAHLDSQPRPPPRRRMSIETMLPVDNVPISNDSRRDELHNEGVRQDDYDGMGRWNDSATAVRQNSLKKEFAKHGVVQYMRPDGFGNATQPRIHCDHEICDDDESAAFQSSLKNVDRSSGVSPFATMLSLIAHSNVPDRANRAGKVLKIMKESGIATDASVIDLLRLCTEIEYRPNEPKPQDLEYTEQDEQLKLDYKTPSPMVKKKVRFSNKNSFRIIRRRRSIGSNERWDDPLTPPKRLADPVDLALERFSSAPRDNRPLLPRRSNSVGSHHSHSSTSMDSPGSASSSISASIDSMSDEEQIGDRLKLPFGDSPQKASDRKRATVQSTQTESRKTGVTVPETPPALPRRKLSERRDTVPSPSNAKVVIKLPENFHSPGIENSTTSDDGNPVEMPPPSSDRPRVRRRRSISGIERRAFAPLTPPRRVSAPLELFLFQQSLKAKGTSTSTTISDGNESAAYSIPSLGKSPRKKFDKNAPVPLNVRVGGSITDYQSMKDGRRRNPPLNPTTNALVRHRELISEHWSVLEFHDKIQTKGLGIGSDNSESSCIARLKTIRFDGEDVKETPGQRQALSKTSSFDDGARRRLRRRPHTEAIRKFKSKSTDSPSATDQITQPGNTYRSRDSIQMQTMDESFRAQTRMSPRAGIEGEANARSARRNSVT